MFNNSVLSARILKRLHCLEFINIIVRKKVVFVHLRTQSESTCKD